MGIVFEEVTGSIEPAPREDADAAAPPAVPAPAEELGAQLERELRLRDERAARLCTD